MTTPDDAPLTGAALTIWREVVVRLEHLVVENTRGSRAVILPAGDLADMRRRVGV